MPLNKHPTEFFMKYLMTSQHAGATRDDWIQWSIASLGYPPPTPDYLSALRNDVYSKMPASFEPNNRYHRESVRFLREEGIWSLHNQDAAMKEANTLVTDFKPRGIVEQLLLGRMDPKEVAKKVNARCGTHYTQAAIESYRHCYWNVIICKLADWERWLGSYDASTASKALAILKVGPAMALHQAGFQQNLESKTILRGVQEALYFDFLDWKAQPLSPDRTRAMTAIAKAICLTDNQLQHADTALRDSLKAFEQFRMQHSQEEVPGVREVAPHGNFSLSGAKLLESPQGK